MQKGNPVINEYWVTDSSIQSAAPDRATMLLFMQGRRGAAPEERYITATVRVVFVKGSDSALARRRPHRADQAETSPGTKNESPPQISSRARSRCSVDAGQCRRRRDRGGCRLAGAVAAVLMAAAITVSTLC